MIPSTNFSGSLPFHCRIIAVTAFFALLFCVSLVRAESAQASPAADLERQTRALAGMAFPVYDDGVAPTAGFVAEMSALAGARRDLFRKLMEEDPATALHAVIPAHVRDRLPTAVQPYIEVREEIDGRLEMMYEHRHDGSRLVHLLDTGDRKLELFHAGDEKLAPVMPGTHISVRGYLSGDAVLVAAPETDVSIMGFDAADLTSSATLADTYETIGEQRTLVLLVNWLDDPTEPFTINAAHELVFGTLDQYIRENSFLQTWVSGQVRGWYTLPMEQPTDPYTGCRQSTVAEAARQAAREDGVNLDDFDRFIYVFPGVSCLPSGSATVGGYPSEAWIEAGWFQLKTVAHEFGHNLGLFHAGAMDCEETSVGSNCQVSPYRDVMDVMGNQAAGHFNGYKKERLGWLAAGSGVVTAASTGGSYGLEAYAAPAGGLPKAVKILKERDAETGEPTWYYVEYRQALGFDGFLADNDNVLNGLVVRMATETPYPDPVSSLLLDMTPGSDSYDDLQDPALPFGSTFSDPASGVVISVKQGSDGTAVVEVQQEAASCQMLDPQLSVTPIESAPVEPGTSVSYTLTLVNNDSADCPATRFDFAASIPSGWSALFGQNGLSLDPGSGGAATVLLTSPAELPDGSYPIDLMVSRSDAGGGMVTTTVSYVVGGFVSNSPPVAVDDSAQTRPGVAVRIDVLSNDSDPDSDPLSVTSVTDPRQGSATVSSDGTVVYTPRKGAKDTDTFEYVVSDGNMASRAQVAVTIAGDKATGGPSDGGKGDGNGNGKKK